MFLVLFLIIPFECSSQVVNFVSTYELLYSNLLIGYRKEIRPSLYVNVSVDFSKFEILKIDEKNKLMNSSCIIEQSWNDSRLTWDPSAFNNLLSIQVDLVSIWKPDLIIYNSVRGDGFLPINKQSSYASVNYKGQVKFKSKALSIQTFCELYSYNYPFDNQTCTIRLVSWMYFRYLTFEISNETINNLANTLNSLWNLTRINLNYILTDGILSDIEISFSLKRKSL